MPCRHAHHTGTDAPEISRNIEPKVTQVGGWSSPIRLAHGIDLKAKLVANTKLQMPADGGILRTLDLRGDDGLGRPPPRNVLFTALPVLPYRLGYAFSVNAQKEYEVIRITL